MVIALKLFVLIILFIIMTGCIKITPPNSESFGSGKIKVMTLDDVRAAAALGDALRYGDISGFSHENYSSDAEYLNVIFDVQGGYHLIVSTYPDEKPDSVYLQMAVISYFAHFDIRYGNLDKFLEIYPPLY